MHIISDSRPRRASASKACDCELLLGESNKATQGWKVRERVSKWSGNVYRVSQTYLPTRTHTQRAFSPSTFTPVPRTLGRPPCRLFPDTQSTVRPKPKPGPRFHRAEEGWGWAGGETPHSRDVAVALVRKLNLSNLAGLGDGQVFKGGSHLIHTRPGGDEPGASLACSYTVD